MPRPSWTTSPARLASLLFVAVAVLVAGLGWLGYRVLEQQADLDHQRTQTQLTNAATLVAREVDRELSRWESVAGSAIAGDVPAGLDGLALVVMDNGRVVRAEGLRLPYYPIRFARATFSSASLEAAQAAEFRRKDFAAAAELYSAHMSAPDKALRAVALLGASRSFQRLGRTADALRLLDRLALLDDAFVGGFPAVLVAHRTRLAFLEAAGDRRAAATERQWLTTALSTGRIPIDRSTYDEYVRSLGLTPTPSPLAVAIADTIGASAADWARQTSGRVGTASQGLSFVTVYRRNGSRLGIVTGETNQLAAAVGPLTTELNASLLIQDEGNRTVWGGTEPATPRVSRSLREWGLPWNLTLATAAPIDRTWLSRQQVFAVGFGLLAVVVVGATYTAFRAVSKELAVARLQSDFVSAVSHEFRTPLTALRHVSDLLREGAVSPEALPEFYDAMGKESRRLQGLVENLLDFGKIEEGRRVYDVAEVDAVSLTREVISDVSLQAAANGHEVRLTAPEESLPVRVDHHAVVLALRNILENAVKYSPDAPAIDVRVRSKPGGVAISVQDYGLGVPPAEQRAVFHKFVRGTAARRLMIKGTGIGLAMADRIVRDHGGSITLESTPGRGSIFTVNLPRAHA